MTSAPGVVSGDGPAGIHEARDTARVFTGGLTPAPGSGAVDSVVLMVSELVTNALRHGGGRYSLELSAGTVSVSGAEPRPGSGHGRGRGRGKTIYAVLPR
ncbi:ATP-binding protein [Streptomyces sp. NBC_01508]|uniref:ATP-binding protein n=1 Tax=Streptomyces sp. NBC_01508 TaxID=2903888 RepID=UPI00386CA9FC